MDITRLRGQGYQKNELNYDAHVKSVDIGR